jgi:hypothetical protein
MRGRHGLGAAMLAGQTAGLGLGHLPVTSIGFLEKLWAPRTIFGVVPGTTMISPLTATSDELPQADSDYFGTGKKAVISITVPGNAFRKTG